MSTAWLRRKAPQIVVPVLLALLWELATRTEVLDPRYFVPLSTIAVSLWELTVDGVLVEHVGATLQRLLLGFAIAAGGGVVLGIAAGVSRTVDMILRPLVDTLYPVPKIALLPLLIILVGIGEPAFVLTAFATAFFQIIISVTAGVRDLDPLLVEAGHNYGARGRLYYTRVLIPGILPSLLHGLRIGMGMCLITVIAVEFVAVTTSGVGYLVSLSWQQLQVPSMYAGLITAGLLGHLINLVFRALERVLLPWRAPQTALRAGQAGG
jgi:ABC-type nitrate/sulfonate/bicarbonate transport system permease component